MVQINKISNGFERYAGLFSAVGTRISPADIFSISSKMSPFSLGDFFQQNKLFAYGKNPTDETEEKEQTFFREMALPEGSKVSCYKDKCTVTLSQNTKIDGYECIAKSSVDFYPDKKIRSATLAKGQSLLGTVLSEDTGVLFFHSGRPARIYQDPTLYVHPESPELRVIGEKRDKGFELFLDDILENNDADDAQWAQFFVKLSNPETIGSGSYPKDSVLSFHNTGAVWRAYVPSQAVLDGINIPGESKITFYDNGKINFAVLGEKTIIRGIEFPQGAKISFYRSGNPKSADLNPEIKGDPFIMYEGEKYDDNYSVGFDPYSKEMKIIGEYMPGVCDLPDTKLGDIKLGDRQYPIVMHNKSRFENTVQIDHSYTFGGKTFDSGTILEFDVEGRLRQAYTATDFSDPFFRFKFPENSDGDAEIPVAKVGSTDDKDPDKVKFRDPGTACITILATFDENGNEIK